MTDEPVHIISDQECFALLGVTTFGRIAFAPAGIVEIFPVNFVAEGARVVFRTAPGTKLAGMLIASDVALEIDYVGERDAWSVVAHGTTRLLEHEEELAAAEALGIEPFVRTVKREFVELVVTRISGRRFDRDATPADDVADAS